MEITLYLPFSYANGYINMWKIIAKGYVNYRQFYKICFLSFLTTIYSHYREGSRETTN